MAFVYHDHEGFRPAEGPKKPRRGPWSTVPVQELVSRATEEVEANCKDWLSDCRSERSFLR